MVLQPEFRWNSISLCLSLIYTQQTIITQRITVMITTTRMSYYQQPEAALILLLMRHLQEHKGCVCCRGVWMDDSCTDQHLVRSGTGRAGPSQAEPSQVRFLSKKLISQADCWRASQKQSHRHREEESARFSSADCC